ncbi:hypothetical protein [Mucilaginibacter paludis]|uniref:TerB family tellurite resistance protein n=1 Tax=Mucilaginibacter paludis DSM 18603 TaxID=714943 RepID=H1YDU4_9SPHI|nr:hypothetical protein [Mucilaginibacter paludis]EHQ24284.1 hypothetical protein Mucpa_0081 [Mucilaginibacter paludis DSM 18603]
MKKKCLLLLTVMTLTMAQPAPIKAQSVTDLLQQLALDYQKLAGLKSILKQMYQGYEVVDKGFNSVKDVSKGNFSLHEAFLNGLMVVSPAVRKYPRVKDIISDQASLISEYKSAYNTFRQNTHFNPDELSYMGMIYNNLVSQSLQNLDELSLVMGDNQLRMSHDERLQAIDRIYADGHNQLTFLRKFNNQVQSIALTRAKAAGDNQSIQKLYGIPQ